ncbi:MAG: hypothetical protein AAFV88_24885 [Planctomycetota bacterium]
MIRKSFYSFAFAIAAVFVTGCDSGEPTNMMEGVDAEELADYDAMIAADAQQMDNEDKSDTTKAK